MLFSELTSYFEQLEKTSSRLALIAILVELFKVVKKDELQNIIYLTQGRVAPFYAPIEMGMADKMVAQAVANSYTVSKEDVLKLYSQKGDMGEAAFELSEKFKVKSEKLTVEEVFDALLAIAHTSGEGSVEKKIGQLQSILGEVEGISVKHLVRIPLGNNRLGIGDPTILDGLALAFLGDKTQRKLLEKAYNETSDLGLIATTLVHGGLEAVQKLGVTVGRPVRSELCERLPNPTKVFEKMDPEGLGLHATPKYDGFRVQIHKNGSEVRMFSRNLEEMTHMFPELTAGTLSQIKARTIILDSEALAYQPESEEFLPFQETTKRRRKHNIEEVAKTLPLKAFVFDILYYDGKSLLDMPLRERDKILTQAIIGDETLIPAPREILTKPEQLQLMLDDSISKGLEGVVVKKIDSPYVAGGRNFNWIKLKRHSSGELHDTIDCVILGYIFGKGKRTAFGAGALLVGVYDAEADEFVSVSRIGTGLSDEEWTSIKTKAHGLESEHKPARVNSKIEPSVWLKPELVIEVLADEITKSPMHTAGLGKAAKVPSESEELKVAKETGYALRFPRLVSFRDKDKRAEDATTVIELIEMYNQQGKK
ncbi:ATP-dependent DNA ligase [soil metagenome]